MNKIQTSLETVEKQPIEIQEVDNSPVGIFQMAMTKGLDLDKVEKIIELQERFEANEARKAYNQAMADFKANAPTILKDRKVGFNTQKGKTNYSHATLGNVTQTINSELSKYGLSAAWKTTQKDNSVTVKCTITHCMGHSDSTELTAGADNSGSKNSIQALGSTITYLERYTILGLTGLATHDQDDDGAGSGDSFITDKQKGHILDMIALTNTDVNRFLNLLKIPSIDEMPDTVYAVALSLLKSKEKNNGNS